MTIDEFAEIYVEYIEPAAKLGAFLVLVIVVMHVLNVIRNGGSGGGFVAVMFQKLVGIGRYLLDLLKKAGLLLVWGMSKITNVIISTVRDFFTAKF